MKRETLRHPKTYDLACRLNCDRSTALGLLVLLWDFTGDHAISGDVGKWNNGAIARACDFSGDPDVFVNSLVAAGWLDESEQHRLVVHDWPDHCEDWVRKKLERASMQFCSHYGVKAGSSVHKKHGTRDAETPVSPPECHRSATGVPSESLSEPNRTQPNRSNPVRTEPARDDGDGNLFSVSETDGPIVMAECARLAKVINPGQGGRKIADRELCYRIAVLKFLRKMPESILADSLNEIREKPKEKPAAFLIAALILRGGQLNPAISVSDLLSRVDIPPWARVVIDNPSQAPPVSV